MNMVVKTMKEQIVDLRNKNGQELIDMYSDIALDTILDIESAKHLNVEDLIDTFADFGVEL